MPSGERPTHDSDPHAVELPSAADVPLWSVIRGAIARPADAGERVGAGRPEAPRLVELIWSYWLEEGGLVRTIDAICLRFQNRRQAGAEALADVRIDVLRPLGHLLWEYVQDEPRRLTVRRRAHEYEHEYGLALRGVATEPVERRTRFPRALDDLLGHAAAVAATGDDRTTADAPRLLRAIRAVHELLAEGAHNQFGDLPATARQEMLVQQWLLSRPEFDDVLPSTERFPEPWMARVDAVRRLQSRDDASIRHYRDLAAHGEQLLLSLRYGDWSAVTDPGRAASWARFWRHEVEAYVAAQRAVRDAER